VGVSSMAKVLVGDRSVVPQDVPLPRYQKKTVRYYRYRGRLLKMTDYHYRGSGSFLKYRIQPCAINIEVALCLRSEMPY